MTHRRPSEIILHPPTMLRKDFVRELSPETLDALERIRTRHRLLAGEVLFTEGEPATRLYEIGSGTIKLWIPRPESAPRVLRIVRAGELLGLREVVAGTHYRVNAVAATAVEYFSMPRKGFLDLLHRKFDAGFSATRMLSVELSSAHETLRGLIASSGTTVRERRTVAD